MRVGRAFVAGRGAELSRRERFTSDISPLVSQRRSRPRPVLPAALSAASEVWRRARPSRAEILDRAAARAGTACDADAELPPSSSLLPPSSSESFVCAVSATANSETVRSSGASSASDLYDSSLYQNYSKPLRASFARSRPEIRRYLSRRARSKEPCFVGARSGRL